MPKDYLGDGMFAEVVEGKIKLSKFNEIGPNDIIYLEPEVYHRLVQFVESIQVVPKPDPGSLTRSWWERLEIK